MREERDFIKNERFKLSEQREEFLVEVDRRVKQRIEDWEVQSLRSITTMAKKMKLMSVDGQDASIQTTKRMNEIEKMDVGVGHENQEELLKRMMTEKQLEEEEGRTADINKLLETPK